MPPTAWSLVDEDLASVADPLVCTDELHKRLARAITTLRRELAAAHQSRLLGETETVTEWVVVCGEVTIACETEEEARGIASRTNRHRVDGYDHMPEAQVGSRLVKRGPVRLLS